MVNYYKNESSMKTQKQKSDLVLEVLNKSFQGYFKKYPDTKLDWTIDYPNFTTGDMIISIEPQSKKFNEKLVNECFTKFVEELQKLKVFVITGKSWIFEVCNEDLPHSIDYQFYISK